MRIPLTPPPIQELLEAAVANNAERIAAIISYQIGPTPGGKYRHWDILRHLPPPHGLTSEEWWLGVKMARRVSYQTLPNVDKGGAPFRYAMPDALLRMLHQVDRDAGGAIKGSDQISNPATRDTYLFKSLVEEAITSSQLEGAATTREVAKEMLQTGRQPRNHSEQMIFNNYNAMLFIREIGKTPLTPGIVFELQRILTEHTLDDPTAAGRFRTAEDQIQVVDPLDGTPLHIPPAPGELAARMGALCTFANTEAEDIFVHPVLRSILLHFWLGYDHPFVDGNGRTARAVFYWSMRTQGYWLSEYVSISHILRRAPAQYVRAFLYAETDDNDVTYFLLYQLRVLLRAVDTLHRYLRERSRTLRATKNLLQDSVAFRDLVNHRQLALINHALANSRFVYTINSHRKSHRVSYQTARTDLLQLAEHGLLDQSKRGRAFVFQSPPDLRTRIERFDESGDHAA